MIDMRFAEPSKASVDSFRQRSYGKKILLLYPWGSFRNHLLRSYLSQAKDGLLYYRIPSDQTTLVTWLRAMTAEFATTLNGFGDKLNKALNNPNPVNLAKALAGDLAAHSKEQIVVFVDEVDRIPLDQDFEEFINTLIKVLPDHVQIAFSSRLLTHQIWYDLVLNGQASVMGTEFRRNDLLFTIENSPKPQLEVYALGRGYALVDGQMINNWDGGLPRNLFFYFMDHPMATRDEIFKTFWPNLSVREATNVFHVTKRKITERISSKVSEPGNYELTQYAGGYYTPSDKVIRHYDVAEFEDAVARANDADDEREEVALLTRAIDTYKAPFLQMIEMEWVRQRRAELREKYARALISMGRIHRGHDENEPALYYFNRALKEVPSREDILREVMTIYLQLGRIDEGRRQYLRVSQILQDTLNISPSKETRDLFEKLEKAR